MSLGVIPSIEQPPRNTFPHKRSQKKTCTMLFSLQRVPLSSSLSLAMPLYIIGISNPTRRQLEPFLVGVGVGEREGGSLRKKALEHKRMLEDVERKLSGSRLIDPYEDSS